MANVLQEITQAKDRKGGFRGLFATFEDPESQTFISVTVHRNVNMALYDEAPHYVTMPNSVESNVTLAQRLMKMAGVLLERAAFDSLPSEMLLIPDTLPHPEFSEPAPRPTPAQSDPPPCCA